MGSSWLEGLCGSSCKELKRKKRMKLSKSLSSQSPRTRLGPKNIRCLGKVIRAKQVILSNLRHDNLIVRSRLFNEQDLGQR